MICRAILLVALTASSAGAQDTTSIRASGDSITMRFADADLRMVLQAVGRYLSKPIVFGNLPAVRATLETPRPIARGELSLLLRGMLETHNLELIEDSTFFRVGTRAEEAESRPVSASVGTPQLSVVRLRHARAADVAATLSALYGGGRGDFASQARSGTLSEELRRNRVQPSVRGAAPSAPEPGASTTSALEGSITIVPDAVTNALFIRATPHDADLLAQAIRELDVRPLQVLIEVVIVEARRDRQLSYGLGAQLPATGIGGDATVEATMQGGGLGDFVIRVLNLGRPDLELMLRAGASRGDVEILSRPVLVAANNQEARFLVGSQRPFIQVSYSSPSSVAGRDQVVQYKDVGIRLHVRPTISMDGYVTLEVSQEVSSATNETAFDAPVISTREATTQVTVKNAQTIVIGGLSDRQQDRTRGGVPFLSDLPLIGGFFGRYATRTNETELFLFLTPRVLATDEDVEGLTRGYRERAPERLRESIPAQEPRP